MSECWRSGVEKSACIWHQDGKKTFHLVSEVLALIHCRKISCMNALLPWVTGEGIGRAVQYSSWLKPVYLLILSPSPKLSSSIN